MIGVMEESLPLFRRYLKQKAEYLGLQRCAFFDIFAPLKTSVKTWSFDEARDFILRQFSLFSKELSEFAAYAFDKHWIDAEPRQGKVGGAYCIDFPLNRSTRVLCNFSGSFSSVSTLAHELGHAYHHHVLKDTSHIHRDYPMTLAETASIFSESIVYDGALSQADAKGKIGIIEMLLQDTTQVIVDILSRYYFERAVMERKKDGELSPEEFSSIMVDAQKKTYGSSLDESELHPYMWAVKGHYYQQDLAFYNFPYAFGKLFGQGLYSLYKREGTAFAETYRNILGKTGITDANTLTKEVGFDIEQPDFWRQGISMIEESVNQFEQLKLR